VNVRGREKRKGGGEKELWKRNCLSSSEKTFKTGKLNTIRRQLMGVRIDNHRNGLSPSTEGLLKNIFVCSKTSEGVGGPLGKKGRTIEGERKDRRKDAGNDGGERRDGRVIRGGLGEGSERGEQKKKNLSGELTRRKSGMMTDSSKRRKRD